MGKQNQGFGSGGFGKQVKTEDHYGHYIAYRLKR